MAAGLTCDSLFDGRLHIRQYRSGYRFSVDSILLAGFAGRFLVRVPVETVLDLGTGCGVVPLILAVRNSSLRVLGVEIQADLARLATRNVRENGLEDRVRIHTGDMTRITPALAGGDVALVTANPPFHPKAAGRLNPNRQKAVARHELAITLSGVVAAASRMLAVGGTFAAIYPLGRKSEVLAAMADAALSPKVIQQVIPKSGGTPSFFLVAGEKGGSPEMTELPPFVIASPSGEDTPEMAALYRL